MKRISLGLIATAVVAPGVLAAVSVDGTINMAEYTDYQAATQTTQTGFGDNTDPTVDANSGGMELDTLSVTDDATHLYIGIPGNAQPNGNFICIFLDLDNNSGTGASTIPAGGFDFANGTQLPLGAELAILPNAGGPDYTIYCNVHQYGSGAQESNFLGSVADPGVGVVTAGTITGNVTSATQASGSFSIDVAINDANIAGVDGGSGAAVAASAEAVSTGLEIAIPRTLLTGANGGNPSLGGGSGQIGIYCGIASSGGFFANQFLPGLATPAGNVGNTPNLSGESAYIYTLSVVPVELSVFTTE